METQDNNNQFVTKKVEQPIFGSEVKEQVIPVNSVPEGFGFYESNKYYIWAIAGGLLVIGTLAFFAFRQPSAPVAKEAMVELQIAAPEKTPSGGDAVYNFKIQNNDPQKLTALRLELAYPSGVTYLSSVPKADNLSGNVFTIPDLISGQNAVVMVRAKISGNVGDQKQIIARLFYHFNNFNSEFIKEKAFSFNLAPSDIALNLTGPQTISNAQLVEYVVKYKNNSDKTVQNSRIRANFPEGFVVASSDPAVSLGQNIWELSNLPPGAEGQIQILGSYKAVAGESRTWNVEFLVLGANGEYNSQSSQQITTQISSLPLLVSQEVEASGETSGQKIAKPGEVLQFTLSYQNNSPVAATGVNIVASLNSKVLDLSSIQAEGGEVNNNTIIWTAAGVPNLEILNPSESGSLRFSVKIKDPAVKDSSTNLNVVSEVKIKSNEYQTFFPGNSENIKISSPSSLTASLNFVSGQLPPKVGQMTTYRVFLKLSNSTNSYSDAVLTAFVPLGLVAYDEQSVNSAEAGKLEYDPATGKLTWKVGILPANAGRFSSAKILEFNLRLNPSSSQAGQSPTLLKNITFQARDSFTEEKIQLTGENVTTNTIEGGYGNGTVQN